MLRSVSGERDIEISDSLLERRTSKTNVIHFAQKGSYKMLSAIAGLVTMLVMVLSPVLIPAAITAFHHLAQLRQRRTPDSV
jgi:hypothetical protein